MARVALAMGEVYRQRGDLTRAWEGYLLSQQEFAAIGAYNERYARLNLAIVGLARRRWAEARRHAEVALRSFGSGAEARYPSGCAHLAIACVEAAEGHWADAHHHLAEGRAALTEGDFVEADTIDMLVLLATEAEKPQPGLAREALALGLRFADQIGDGRRRQSLHRRLAALGH